VVCEQSDYISEDYMIEETMGSSYDQREKWIIFIVHWLDYSDNKD
jgi:hypothetical protein